MGKIVVHDSESVEPTIFQGRESRRLISPERDGSQRMSLHQIHPFVRGMGKPNLYAENDEILYLLEGDGLIYEGGGSISFQGWYVRFYPSEHDLPDL